MDCDDFDTTRLPMDSMIDACRLVAAASGGTYIEKDGIHVSLCPFGGFYSRALLDPETEVTPNSVRKTFDIPENPSLVSFQSPAEDISKELEDMGLVRLFYQYGMVFPMEGYIPEPEDGDIVRLDPSDAVAFTDAVQEGFVKRPREEGAMTAFLSSDNAHCFGYVPVGEIIGTGILTINGDISGIHEISVLPEYRGKGIATDIMERILGTLSRHGARYVSLQASAAGRPVYARLGFKDVSTIETWALK